MKYYIIAGEASGDLHGSNLMKGISDDYYFYNSDTIRFIIFEDSVENEKKMREIL